MVLDKNTNTSLDQERGANREVSFILSLMLRKEYFLSNSFQKNSTKEVFKEKKRAILNQ